MDDGPNDVVNNKWDFFLSLACFKFTKHIDIKNVIEHHHPHVAAVAPMVVVAPMAGQVVQVLVKDGTKVKKGQPIFVLETLEGPKAISSGSETQSDTEEKVDSTNEARVDTQVRSRGVATQSDTNDKPNSTDKARVDTKVISCSVATQSETKDTVNSTNTAHNETQVRSRSVATQSDTNDKTNSTDKASVYTKVLSSSDATQSDAMDTVDYTNEMDVDSFLSSFASGLKNELEESRKSHSGIFHMEDVLLGKDDAVDIPMATLDNEDVFKRYETFNKFNSVNDHSDHHFSEPTAKMEQRSRDWDENINKELKTLEEELPEGIFVRLYKTRKDLLRAVIIGQKGTPYHDGLFFFDVCFPSTYPISPPLVFYHSGGLWINTYLYISGYVRLILPKTSNGRMEEEEMWVPGTSNVLQLFLFLKNLFNAKPLLNDVIHLMRTPYYREPASLIYNENTFVKSLKTMVYVMKEPPKNFEDLVVGHFRKHVVDILKAYNAYMEGLQVGCPLSSLLEEEGNKGTGSVTFKNDLASCIKPLVSAFIGIGAKEAKEFIALS